MTRGGGAADRPDRYKWVVLTNTTLGVLMATIDISIMLIALPDIFRGIHIDPLAPGNSFYLLWMILSFMVVTSVLVVSLGRWATCTAGSGRTTSASWSTRSSRCCSPSPG